MKHIIEKNLSHCNIIIKKIKKKEDAAIIIKIVLFFFGQGSIHSEDINNK